MYEYKCTVIKIVDGDTVDVDIDLGFGIWLKNQRIRINGIDTPESRTQDKIEKIFGLASKQFVKKILPINSTQILLTEIDKSGEDKRGKFGRILGDFLLESTKEKLTTIMIKEGYAVPYHGENKEMLIELHTINRQKLIAAGIVNV